MKYIQPIRILSFLAAAAFLFFCGCTARERAGYSSIPQNTPASWEITPYGEIRN